ncbi:hypothetical protein HanXRQr2_Chr14g0647911 [Helianthus annuus]|uniref:Uncharacterized protein n=1 Tax=Helianthus annuus TaxID=4232 RepID=A0A251SIB0_HELAN|nr:hypothetical protein HanXRQr2_Chr14g0647911 [Helianthus annuus]
MMDNMVILPPHILTKPQLCNQTTTAAIDDFLNFFIFPKENSASSSTKYLFAGSCKFVGIWVKSPEVAGSWMGWGVLCLKKLDTISLEID